MTTVGTPTAHPSTDDPVVRGLSEVIGGPLGEHARTGRRRFWTPMRVVLALTCLALAFNWVQKSPCRDGAWADNEQYTKACYTDVLALYYAEGLDKGEIPYIDHPVEYPVVTGAVMAVVGLPVHLLGEFSGGSLNEGQLFYDLTTLVLGAFALVTAWALVRMRPDRPWDATMFGLAPAFLLTATVNWDLVAVACCVLALLAWTRGSPAATGVLLGLGGAAKLFPLFALGPLVVVCLRQRRYADAITATTAALGTWLAVNLPMMTVAWDSWKRFFDLSTTRPVDWGTIWYIGLYWPHGETSGVPPFTDLAADIPRLNAVSAAIFAVLCVGIAGLALLAPRPPRLEALVFLTVAAFLVSNKVWSQQFVLWLIPLALLARPRWPAFLVWQGFEVVYFIAFYQRLLGASSGEATIPEGVFLLASAGRAISLLVLCGLVVTDILNPNRDIVRSRESSAPPGARLGPTAVPVT
jgi:uncharacterized membrane protein